MAGDPAVRLPAPRPGPAPAAREVGGVRTAAWARYRYLTQALDEYLMSAFPDEHGDTAVIPPGPAYQTAYARSWLLRAMARDELGLPPLRAGGRP